MDPKMTLRSLPTLLLSTAIAIWAAGCGDTAHSHSHGSHDHSDGSHDHSHEEHASSESTEQAQGAAEADPLLLEGEALTARLASFYPLDECLVSGEPLGETMQEITVQGRTVRTCCGTCADTLENSPEVFLAEFDEATREAQLERYPTQLCIVSGEPLGSMGDIIEHLEAGRLVRMCCEGCVKGFQKKSARYFAELDAALIEAQTESYPLTKCVVGGEALDSMGGPVDHLWGDQLVRLCCKGCIKSFNEDPAKYLAVLAQ